MWSHQPNIAQIGQHHRPQHSLHFSPHPFSSSPSVDVPDFAPRSCWLLLMLTVVVSSDMQPFLPLFRHIVNGHSSPVKHVLSSQRLAFLHRYAGFHYGVTFLTLLQGSYCTSTLGARQGCGQKSLGYSVSTDLGSKCCHCRFSSQTLIASPVSADPLAKWLVRHNCCI